MAATAVATSAPARPTTGPNSTPADTVNTVRGMGNTVSSAYARKKTQTNPGPRSWPQLRTLATVGTGTRYDTNRTMQPATNAMTAFRMTRLRATRSPT